jgi:hypothetical protein
MVAMVGLSLALAGPGCGSEKPFESQPDAAAPDGGGAGGVVAQGGTVGSGGVPATGGVGISRRGEVIVWLSTRRSSERCRAR